VTFALFRASGVPGRALVERNPDAGIDIAMAACDEGASRHAPSRALIRIRYREIAHVVTECSARGIFVEISIFDLACIE
jgi:hypothetical protein